MKIAIVGATGEVGRMMLTCLDEFNVPMNTLDLFASERSAGTVLYLGDRALTVQKLEEDSLSRSYDYVLFSAGAGVSLHFAPIAAQNSRAVIDNSSAFRKEKDIPLVVPEINGHLIEHYHGIISNPNCATIQMVLPLAILDHLYGLQKIVVSTYQSVSGSGHKGIETLLAQRNGSQDLGVYPELIDLNVIPQIGAFLDNGYSQEEEKLIFESQKILNLPNLKVCPTAVRVPVLYGHSESIYAEFDRTINLEEAAEALKKAESIAYEEHTYMTPRGLNSSNDSFVCRLRYGVDNHSLCFWNVANNVRLGAATNAVKILIRHAKSEGLL